MFRLEVSHLQALKKNFHCQMLCPLWDPIVFTVMEYVLAKVSRNVYDYKELLQTVFNLLTPNDYYNGRTVPLTSKCRILYIYSTNIGTEYFKHGIYS